MLNDTLIIRVLFYLDRSDLLLIAAVLSKSMNKNTQSDLVWRLTIKDRYDMSSMVILANRHKVLTIGPEYGLAIPTDGQAAEGATPTTPPHPNPLPRPQTLQHTPPPHPHPTTTTTTTTTPTLTTNPTPTLPPPGDYLWYRFYIDVTRAGFHREGGNALVTAAKGGDVPKLRKLLWAMVDTGARGVSAP